MRLGYSSVEKCFFLADTPAGFRDAQFRKKGNYYVTRNPEALIPYLQYAPENIAEYIKKGHARFTESFRDNPMVSNEASAMYGYQLAGVELAVERFREGNKAVLIADQMGLGKTIQAIGIADALSASSIIIICPAVVKYNWENEIKKWGKTPRDVQVISAKTPLKVRTGVTIVNYDIIKRPNIMNFLRSLKADLIVYDESHKLKNHKAQRTRAVFGKGGIYDSGTHHLFLSGTPITNRPVDIWGLASRTSPDTLGYYNNYVWFIQRFCGAYRDNWGWQLGNPTNTEELMYRLRSTIMIRRSKADVLKELPDRILQKVNVDFSENILGSEGKALSQLKPEGSTLKDIIAAYKAGVDDTADAQHIGKVLADMRKHFGESKIPAAVSMAEDILEEEEKLVIFAYHRELIADLSDTLKDYGVVTITGDTPAEKRTDYVKRFQSEGGPRICIANIQAGGVGITLTAASTAIFVETTWDPSEIEQAVDRLHRIGQKDSVNAYFLTVRNSIDEYIMDKIILKQRSINKMLDKVN